MKNTGVLFTESSVDSNDIQAEDNKKDNEQASKTNKAKKNKENMKLQSLEEFIPTLEPKDQKAIKTFMNNPAYEHFISYLFIKLHGSF